MYRLPDLLARLIDLVPFVGNKLGPYRKAVVFAVGVAVTVAVYFAGTDNEWVSLAILALTGAGLYETPND